MMEQDFPDLGAYSPEDFLRGRSRIFEALWILVQWLILRSPIPSSTLRVWTLRLFGAKIGKGVVIKTGVRIKFPWRLKVGDFSWLGEDVWIDNLAEVRIGISCCVSQGAYLCTGSHNWSSPMFNLIVKPIRIKSGAWIASRAVVGPGVLIGEGAVLSLGAVAKGRLEPWTIYAGNPAVSIKVRRIREISSVCRSH